MDFMGSLDDYGASQRLSDAGRHAEARVKAKKSLDARVRIKGPDCVDTGIALQRLAEVERDLGNFAEALRLCKRAMKIREKTPGEGLDAAVSRYAVLG